MSTCRWCTPSGFSTSEFLKQYATSSLSREDFLSANDDLSYCLECVVEYHKARDELPTLHKVLWEAETSRLVAQFEKTMKDESIDEEELLFVEEDGETKLPEFVGPEFENNLRVPLLEVLKYPYLLLDERLSELCVEALCKMERVGYSFQVFDKHPGIYLLLVHPNELVRRWAILTARTLGKVDRDDYYDLQEAFTCLFKVIELGLFDSPDIYSFYSVEKGKLILLPSHLYDTNNYKNYWLGICMLLSVLEEQTLDSLLLGPDKENDFMQSILHTMERDTTGSGDDPFWPALHCFMVILDRLGAKVWGQLIDPIQAFQTIIDSRSYKNEIENIRHSTRRTKIEPDSDYGDDQVTCSQMVYDFNTEKPKKDSGWRNAICPDYCPNMYEEMQTLTNVLQSDIGQDMRVHNSTFLWFIPFVQSVMDLKDLGVAYIVEVIHHLYSEIKDVLNKRMEYCDKVTEFFILILVSVIELHRNKKCLHLLWVSSQKWVEALVKCAKLPATDFRRYSEKVPGPRISSTSCTVLSMHSQATNSVQYSCVQLIRSLLREGSQLGQQSSCKRFLDKLNLLLRGNVFVGLQLSEKETQDLQVCLKQVIRSSKDRNSSNTTSPAEQNSVDRSPTFNVNKIKREDTDEWSRMRTYCQLNSPSPPLPAESRSTEGCTGSSVTRGRSTSCGEEPCIKEPTLCGGGVLSFYKIDSGFNIPCEREAMCERDAMCENFQETQTDKNVQDCSKNPVDECIMGKTSSQTDCNPDEQIAAQTAERAWEGRCELSAGTPNLLSNQRVYDASTDKVAPKPPSVSGPALNSLKLKIPQVRLLDLHSKLAKAIEKSSAFLKLQKGNENPETQRCKKDSGFSVPNLDKDQSADCAGKSEHVQESSSCASEGRSLARTLLHPNLQIKNEPQESCNDLNVARTKSQEKVSESDSDDNIPLSMLKNTISRQKESPFGSNNVTECSLYRKLGLFAGQQSPNTSETTSGKPPSMVTRLSPVKLRDLQIEVGNNCETPKEFSRASESDSDDSIPLMQVRLNLLSQRKSLPMNIDTSEDSEGDAGKMTGGSITRVAEILPDSRSDTKALLAEDHIERKVKGAVRSSWIEGPHKSNDAHKEIIIISDSTSEEEQDQEDTMPDLSKTIKTEKPSHVGGYSNELPLPSSASLSEQKPIKQEVVEKESSPDRCDQYDSQFFEFETEDEVYSVWQDSQIETPHSLGQQDQLRNSVSTSTENNNQEELDMLDKYTEWGYDTDYIPEDVLEEAAVAAEQQFEKEHADQISLGEKAAEFRKPPAHQELTVQSHYGKKASRQVLAKPADNSEKRKPLLASKPSLGKSKDATENSATKKGVTPSKARANNLPKSSDKAVQRTTKQKKREVAQAIQRNPDLPRTTPAVVPPKKYRKLPEPTSTVEKLGFKKPPRRAFDLSQRSLDSLTELRNHGIGSGAFRVKPKQKSMLISAQALPVKGNRKLLACQDRQFYRQMRPQEGATAKRSEEASKSSDRNDQPKVKANVLKKKVQEVTSTVTLSKQSFEKAVPSNAWCSSKEMQLNSPGRDNFKKAKNVNVVSPITHGPLASDSTDPAPTVRGNLPGLPAIVTSTGMFIGSTEEDCYDAYHASSFVGEQQSSSLNKESGALSEDEDDEDEEEMEEDNLFLTQPDPVDMEICSQSETGGIIETCSNHEQADMEVDAPGVNSTDDPLPPESYKCKQSECAEVVKMAGSYCHKHVIVETSADHVFAVPGLPPLGTKSAKPPTAKVFSAGVSSRSANLSKDLENTPKTPVVSKARPLVSKSSTPKTNPPVLIRDMTSRHPSPCAVLQDLNNQSNIAMGWQTNRASAGNPGSGNGAYPQHAICTSYAPAKQRDSSFLIQEILCWSHEMFTSFNQFGAPNNLSQFPCSNVPLFFSGYEEYFRTFFPLLMLNTFESIVQEWQENQRRKFRSTYQLQLQNFCTDSQINRVDFQVWIRDADLAKQCHVKDDDLIFLVKSQSSDCADGEMRGQPIHYIGHVAHFTRSQLNETRIGEKYTACHLSVQTKGKFAGARNQLVMCEVIGGLVSTQRQFKALLQLRWSPLAKCIINPNPPEFLPRTKVNLATEGGIVSFLKDYNESQRKSIETAYTMVKHHPGIPRICLIHGPPGTGKSKTIVGILIRILSENPPNDKAPNMNLKNKRNRILVCAPSNASIDELMKKIILGFKEKCKDKNHAQGNCGDINLVRLGSEKAISSDVQRFSLDSQVSRKMNKNAFGLDQDIQKKKESLDWLLDDLSRRRAIERCDKQKKNEDLDQEIGRVAAERQQLASQLKEVRKHLPEVQSKIILESDIICCTLNTSGSFLLETAFRRLGHDPFSCVIVDESGQACEVETLIPLIHRCSKLILVGDPEQLPATVISTKAEDYGYGQSMMARMRTRLQEATSKTPVLQLTVQYRMHPDICLFPSAYIYGKTLYTDRMTEELRCSSKWPFQPYLLFDVSDGTERRENESSYANFQEVKLVITLIKLLKEKKKDMGFYNIGIITPYRAQKNMIIQELGKEFGTPNRHGEVDTVDGFQGRQKDCIIVTCVRANSCQGSIGFLASRQRMNVTITRAKSSLFILGSLKTLMENKDWNQLIQDAQRRGAIIKTREENYSKDATKILKLKPSFLRSHSFPSAEETKKPLSDRPQQTVPQTERKESANGSTPSVPVPAPFVYRTAGAPPEAVVPQLYGSKLLPGAASAKATSTAPVPSIGPTLPIERPRDPRLSREPAAGVTQPSRTGHTLPHGSGHFPGQTWPTLPHRTAGGSVTPSRTPQTISSSDNDRNMDNRLSWQANRNQTQGNWNRYTENRQWDRQQDDRSRNKREHSQQSDDAKRQKTSNYNIK
ncbi:putative helicase senataxin [Lissotriton helveticus]